jgi:hypothetical protein
MFQRVFHVFQQKSFVGSACPLALYAYFSAESDDQRVKLSDSLHNSTPDKSRTKEWRQADLTILHFRTLMRKHMPNMRQMFTMFEPKTFPMATPTPPWPRAAKTDTLSSGRDVENATSMNPTVVFPKPVISAILTELAIVQLLALFSKSNPATSISMFIRSANSSNTSSFHVLALFSCKSTLKSILEFSSPKQQVQRKVKECFLACVRLWHLKLK